MKKSDDQTFFAWQLEFEYTTAEICRPLATSPSQSHGSSYGMQPKRDSPEHL
jgi:hypothetical protein